MSTLQNENTLSFEESKKRIVKFYEDCERFWTKEKENFSHNYTEEINVKRNALQEIVNLRNDPFSPKGKKIDPTAKTEFFKTQDMFNEFFPHGEKAKVGDSIQEDERGENVYVVTGRYFEGGVEDNGILYVDENNKECACFDGCYTIVAYTQK